MRVAKKTLVVTGAAFGAALLLGTAAATAGGWGGHGHGGWMGGPGMGGAGMGGMGLIDSFDTNKDGKVTQAEIDADREQRLKRFDRDGNGELTLEEYEALWLDAMRQRMVRQFQANDRDGNGSITIVEFQERYSDVVRNLDRNNNGELTVDELRRRGRDRD
jgi:Ca2+-binding EF-hand superfamily protein